MYTSTQLPEALDIKFTGRHDPQCLQVNSPRVVINHFAFRFDKCIVDDFQLRVNDCHPRQFQALLCVTLVHGIERLKQMNHKPHDL